MTFLNYFSSRAAVVNIGYRCHFQCQHCAVDAGPERTEKISKGLLINLFRDLSQSGFNEIVLTGGEPTLYPELLNLSFKLGKRDHIKVSLATNGWWGDHRELASKIIKGIIESGGSIEISLNEFLGRNLPIEATLKAVSLVLEKMNALSIGCLLHSDNTFIKCFLKSFISKFKVQKTQLMRKTSSEGKALKIFLNRKKKLIITYKGVFPLGRGEQVCIIKPQKFVDEFSDRCPRHILTILPNGKVRLCDVPLKNNFLTIGDLKEGKLKLMLEKCPFIIKNVSPLSLVKKLWLENFDPRMYKFINSCHLCYEASKIPQFYDNLYPHMNTVDC